MRPVELSLRNFRSYFGDAVFDFRDRSLVGIVGPIGSGKSSILDAVAFALYGRTPSGGAGTRALIHQRASDAAVKLRFEVEGEIWEAVRSVRSKGPSQHALYRYPADTPEAMAEEKITQEAEVNERIVDLLGLDFDAFGRSVMLAQNRFAVFLSARPAERDAVLKGVFGLDRIATMKEIATDKAAAAHQQLEVIRVRAEQLDGVARRIAQTEQEIAAVTHRIEALAAAEPVVAGYETSIREGEQAEKRAVEALAGLEALEDRLPVVVDVERMVAAAASATERRERIAVDLDRAEGDRAAAEAAVDEALGGGEQADIDKAAELLAAAEPQRRIVADTASRRETLLGHVADLDKTLAGHESDLGRLVAALAESDARLTVAADDLEVAERAAHEARHADMAASLRRTLTTRDACPVCAQEVTALPDPLPAADLDAAEALVVARRREAAAARQGRDEVATEHAGTVRELGATGRQLDATRRDLDETEAQLVSRRRDLDESMTGLTGLLGEGDPVDLLAGRRQALNALSERAAGIRTEVRAVRLRHDEAIRDEQAAEAELGTIRSAVTEMATRLDRPLAVGVRESEALAKAARDLAEAWQEAVDGLTTEIVESRRLVDDSAKKRDEITDGLGVEGSLTAALAAQEMRRVVLGEHLEKDRAEIAAAGELYAARDALVAEHGRFARIGRDLTDSRFVRFLLDEERVRLADLGSDHFQRLSSGRYRFTEDGAFSIVDLTAADAVRKASSLSGGETFLAALALALALAEMVSRTGGRLDAFFLDEGFGSLDAEHLDLAMDGIEALVAEGSNRLVVVVSHVPEMRHRIEDLIELDRSPLTGDTRVVSA